MSLFRLDAVVVPVASRLTLEPAILSEATEFIINNHYLKRGRTMAQLPYWINFDSQRAGVMLFALPRMSVRSAKFGNRSPMEIIELARLWIEPSLQQNQVVDSNGGEHTLPIATMAIAKALKTLRHDWNAKYPNLPPISACVAWSDDTLHQGTIYRAANFSFVGKSGGTMHSARIRNNGGTNKLNPDYLHQKSAFLFEFRKPVQSTQNREFIDPSNIK
jgi:hypothetical protein